MSGYQHLPAVKTRQSMAFPSGTTFSSLPAMSRSAPPSTTWKPVSQLVRQSVG